MIVLGLDTATPTASVALVEDGKLVAEQLYDRHGDLAQRSLSQPKGNHAEIVLPLIQAVLAQRKISLQVLSGLAVSIGPGSFTGLRISLATVKGIAYEWGVPVVGVSTLLANAARVKDHAGVICSLMDARKREVYTAIFRRQGADLTPLVEERVCSISMAIDLLRDAGASNAVVIGDGAKGYEPLLTRAFGASVRISTGAEFGTVAGQIALLAWPRMNAHGGADLAALVPRYLRSSEAENKLALQL